MNNFFKDKRIGFCCKWKGWDEESKKLESDYNFKGTTLTYIKKLKTRKEQFEKVYYLVEHNLKSLHLIFDWLGKQPKTLRMFRMGSDLLPFYTHDDFLWVYKEQPMLDLLHKELPVLGDKARTNKIRLSLHPGQFCILNSKSSDVIRRAVMEFEYHVDVMRMMNFSGWHPYGLEINVHGVSKDMGLTPLLETMKTLSEEAKNWISIENDEYCFGISDLHRLADQYAILLDVHHHYIASKGEFIDVNDARVIPYLNSWRGITPELHFSVSPEYVLKENISNLPDYNFLLSEGFSRTDLRKHSDMTFNQATNDWVLSFSDTFDICVEAKHKNLASVNLYNRMIKLELNTNR